MSAKPKMALVVCAAMALATVAGPVAAAVWYFDDFDGTSPNAPVWVNATDDSGEFVQTGGVFRGSNVGAPWWGRAPYAYFSIPQAIVDAGYTLTVKGRGIPAPGDQGPVVGLQFGVSDWLHGNWFFTGWGGANVMYAAGDWSNGQWLGGGGLSSYNTWYWMKAEVAGGVANMYVSPDGVNWTLRGTRNITHYANNVGVHTGNLSISGQEAVISEYDWVMLESPLPIPEPGSLVALAAGIMSFAGLAAKRRRA